ncbi:DNA repair protein [Scheffersomyces coipomensis]|uniref:DNA repair protein n=1 Tax=Scheffersomyces coipomensis TaxID=1788519 RepID=UPI00315C5BF2
MGNDRDQYSSFLRSLDNSELIQYINSLSQSQSSQLPPVLASSRQQIIGPTTLESEGITSTPIKRSNHKRDTSQNASLISSDPFNDDLDENDISVRVPANEDEPEEEDNEDEKDNTVGSLHGFGDYATYFHNKHLKQQKLDQEYINWDAERRKTLNLSTTSNTVLSSTIFESCIIFVNGHTNPSINEIHRLVILNGGKFISYLTKKSAATHIICSRLTPRKKIEFRNYKIVKPEWIVDCINQGKLLDWKLYRIIEDIDYGQKRLNFNNNDDDDSNDDPILPGQQVVNDSDSDEVDENQMLPLTQPDEEKEPNSQFSLQDINEEEQKDMEKVFENSNSKSVDAKHPDFLKHFFANSRLHHLSVWKADLRLKFLRKIIKDQSNSMTSKHNTKKNNKRSIIMHIDFDCFFATASCLNHPKLDINKDPIAVTHGLRTSDIASCNYVARKFGVKNGMWVTGALKLCPNLIKLDYDFVNYEKYSNEFYNYLSTYNDKFDTIFPVSIDEVLVDITSYCEDHDDDDLQTLIADLCTTIRRDIFQLTKCTVSIGVSYNVLLAKLAIKKAKPDGYYFLHDNIEESIKSFSIKDLPGIGGSIMEKLSTMLQKSDRILIEDILSFSKSRLITEFGDKTGTKLYQFARGIDDTSIQIDYSNPEAVLGRKSVSVDVNYGIRFETFDHVDDFLMRLAKELYSRLVSLGICGTNITLRLARRAPNAPVYPPKYLGMGYCTYVNKSSRLGVPTNDWGVIGSELKALFRMVTVPVHELRGVSVTLTKLQDIEGLKNSNRQMRLPFNQIKLDDQKQNQRQEFSKVEKVKIQPITKLSPTKNTATTTLFNLSPSKRQKQPKVSFLEDVNNIDWEVFDSLPLSLKQEIKQELQSRGLVSYSPVKKSRSSSPIKGNGITKAYMQQLLPSQLGAAPKYVRVIDKGVSPTRKRLKLKSPSPQKDPPPKQVSFQDESEGSYDSSILRELPSSIREDVLKDLEYKKKIKKFDLKPLRQKFNTKIEKSEVKIKSINFEFIKQCKSINPSPIFINQDPITNIIEIKRDLKSWIQTSIPQQGPHEEDINALKEYIMLLLDQKNLTKCLILLEYIERVLIAENINFEVNDSVERSSIEEGIKDWYTSLLPIKHVIIQYSKDNNLQETLQ